jgi:hypothetical protein
MVSEKFTSQSVFLGKILENAHHLKKKVGIGKGSKPSCEFKILGSNSEERLRRFLG